MISDYRYQLSENQQVLTSADSTNDVDLTAILRDVGSGTTLFVDFNITTTFAVANTATDQNTITFGLKIASAGGVVLTLAGISIVHYNLGAEAAPGVPAGPTAIAGDHIVIPIAPLSDGQRRYFAAAAAIGYPFRYLSATYVVDNVAGAGFTAGKVSAALTTHPTSRVGIQYLADAVN